MMPENHIHALVSVEKSEGMNLTLPNELFSLFTLGLVIQFINETGDTLGK
jgi:hypothetical protein